MNNRERREGISNISEYLPSDLNEMPPQNFDNRAEGPIQPGRKNLPRFELPEYDSTVHDPEDYVREFERECELYEYDEPTMRALLARAIKKSKGRRADWYQEEGIELAEYDELKQGFIAAFGTGGRSAVVKTEAAWRATRQKNDDVRTYAAAFARRLRKHQYARRKEDYGEVGDRTIVDVWCDGLKSESMRTYVMMEDPRTWEEAKRLSLDFEQRVYKRSGKYKEKAKHVESDEEEHDEDISEDSEEEKEEKIRPRKKSPVKSTPKTISTKSFDEFKKNFEKKQSTQDKQMEELMKGVSELRIFLSKDRSESQQPYGQGAPRRDLVCYNCQETGHTSRVCPNPMKCRQCGGNHRTIDHQATARINALRTDEEMGRRDFQ